MKRREPEGYWCDVCHQLHYQMNPDCRRRRQEPTFTPEERERSIQSVIASQALSGIAVPREVAEAAFDGAIQGPLPMIGEEEAMGDTVVAGATAPSEQELRDALDSLEEYAKYLDTPYDILDAAITELVALRAVATAAEGALEEIAAVLGDAGHCTQNGCSACLYESASAASTARDALTEMQAARQHAAAQGEAGR